MEGRRGGLTMTPVGRTNEQISPVGLIRAALYVAPIPPRTSWSCLPLVRKTESGRKEAGLAQAQCGRRHGFPS